MTADKTKKNGGWQTALEDRVRARELCWYSVVITHQPFDIFLASNL